jgi:FkbM family methyltransferase
MSSFKIDESGALTTPLHVLQMLPDGRLPVPNKTQELLIEIGTNAFDTWDQQVLPKRPGAFLVAFEPLVDKWSLLLARNARARVHSPLGWHHSRGVVLPFAVSDREGIVPFYVSPRDGCSSLRKTQRPKRGGWKTNGFVRNACARTIETRQVPAITLRTVLGEWLAGWHVTRLKIDAQGSDLSVLAAAGAPLLRRVGEISMETLHDSCDGIYESQPNCSTVVGAMARLGFSPRDFQCTRQSAFTQGSGCEANVNFYNTLEPPAEMRDRRPELTALGRQRGAGRHHGAKRRGAAGRQRQ